MMPGMGRMNPRMMKKLQKQLQSATEELDATEVIIRTKDKELYLQDTMIEFSELIPKLKQIAEQRNDKRIFIRADGTNNYSTIMEIMGALNSSNFSNISLKKLLNKAHFLMLLSEKRA